MTRIALVDDEINILTSVSLALETEGFEVDTYQNGEDAISGFEKIKYDLAIMWATGFTGKLVVEYLIKNYGIENEEFTWAIAGRDKNKLERLRSSFKDIDSNSNKIPILVVDSHDTISLLLLLTK